MKKWLLGGAGVALLPVLAIAGLVAVIVMSAAGAAGGAGGSACGGTSSTLTVTAASGAVVNLDSKQLDIARQVAAAGQSMKLSPQAVQIAFVTIFQETKFRNYANSAAYPESMSYPHDANGSDHDSLGIFQQRPSSGWGSVEELMNPTSAAQRFFGGPNGPNHGSPRGLLDIPNWQTLAVGDAAQKVQVSAKPEAYAQWSPAATELYAAVSGGSCAGGDGSGGVWAAPNGKTGADLVAYAEQFIGKVPYSGACGSAGSPTGWCCTGFVYYVYHQVLGIDLSSPVVSGQLAVSTQIPRAQAKAGDLVAWQGYHIGIYDGKGGVIHSPDWGRMLEHSPTVDFTIGGVGPTFWRVNAVGSW